jgi:hypothetical protein
MTENDKISMPLTEETWKAFVLGVTALADHLTTAGYISEDQGGHEIDLFMRKVAHDSVKKD